jgi:TonB family protein
MKRLLAMLVTLPTAAWAQTGIPTAQSSTPVNASSQVAPSFEPSCAYPQAALHDRASGTTDVEFRVTVDRKIESVSVFHSSGNQNLDMAAIQCIASWAPDARTPVAVGYQRGQLTWSLPVSPANVSMSAPIATFALINRAEVLKSPSCSSQLFGSHSVSPGFAGRTTVAVHIAADGTVRGVDLVRSSGNDDVDQAFESCVSGSWRFRPATLSGTPIPDVKKYAAQWGPPQRPSPTQSTGAARCTNYPAAAIKAKAEGTVIVRLHISKDGAVDAADVVQPSGNTDLDQATAACVRFWHFQPALMNGKDPVAVTMQYAIHWSLP